MLFVLGQTEKKRLERLIYKFTCLALKEVLLLYACMLSLIKLFKPKEETVIGRLHIGRSFITHSFLLKGEEPPVCIGCDERVTVEQFYLIVQILLKQERAILQLSHYVFYLKKFQRKRFVNYLKAVNIFGRI